MAAQFLTLSLAPQVAVDSAAALPSLAAAAALAAAFPRPAAPPSARQSGAVYGTSSSMGLGSPRLLGIEAVSPTSRAASLPQSPSTAHSAQTVQHSGLSGLSMDGQLRSISVGGDTRALLSRMGTQSRGMWDIPFSELQLRRRVGQGAFGAVRLLCSEMEVLRAGLPNWLRCRQHMHACCPERWGESCSLAGCLPTVVSGPIHSSPTHGEHGADAPACTCCTQVYQAEWHQTTCAVKVLLSHATLGSEVRLPADRSRTAGTQTVLPCMRSSQRIRARTCMQPGRHSRHPVTSQATLFSARPVVRRPFCRAAWLRQ